MTDSEKLDLVLAEISKINTEISKINTELSKTNTEVSKTNMEVSKINTEVSKINTELSKTNMEVSKINLHLENVTDRNICILAENHRDLIDKLNQAIKVADKTSIYEIQVNILTERVKLMEKEILEIKDKIA